MIKPTQIRIKIFEPLLDYAIVKTQVIVDDAAPKFGHHQPCKECLMGFVQGLKACRATPLRVCMSAHVIMWNT